MAAREEECSLRDPDLDVVAPGSAACCNGDEHCTCSRAAKCVLVPNRDRCSVRTTVDTCQVRRWAPSLSSATTQREEHSTRVALWEASCLLITALFFALLSVSDLGQLPMDRDVWAVPFRQEPLRRP